MLYNSDTWKEEYCKERGVSPDDLVPLFSNGEEGYVLYSLPPRIPKEVRYVVAKELVDKRGKPYSHTDVFVVTDKEKWMRKKTRK